MEATQLDLVFGWAALLSAVATLGTLITGILFFAVNGVYFPLSEEKGLEQRFGDDYRRYKQNVPRWLPRLSPWNDLETGGGTE